MHIDKGAFLALVTTLAAAACAGSSSDDTADGAGAFSGGSSAPKAGAGSGQASKTADAGPAAANPSNCWDPTREGTSTAVTASFVEELGFDPVGDFPSAESFCLSLAEPGSGSGAPDASIFDKCQSYAKDYVPWVTERAFENMKKHILDDPTFSRMDTSTKWLRLFAFDKDLTMDSGVCTTPSATTACHAVPADQTKACVTALSQVQPAHQNELLNCIDPPMTVYACLEGFGVTP